MIIDLTTGHAILYFIDRFFRYNQIRINKEYRHKIPFVTLVGIFCWVVMAFGLKNVGVTYQISMVSMFHGSVDMYVDDILAKSITEYDNILDLRKMMSLLLYVSTTLSAFGEMLA